MDGRGRCFDNIFTERLWRSVKYEEAYLHDCQSFEEANNSLKKYFYVYNYKRLYEALGYQTPAEIYNCKITDKIKISKVKIPSINEQFAVQTTGGKLKIRATGGTPIYQYPSTCDPDHVRCRCDGQLSTYPTCYFESGSTDCTFVGRMVEP